LSKILYLSYDGVKDQLGQSQILPYLIGLAEKGHHVTLVSFEKQEKEGKTIDVPDNIDWIPLKYHQSPPILSTVLDIQILKRTIKKLQPQKQFDIVHCRSYITAMAGIWMKEQYNTKFLFDMRGFFPDERVEGELWKQDNPLYNQVYRYFKKRELEFLKMSDHIISLTYSGREEIINGNLFKGDGHQRPVKVAPEKITVIPTCVDTRHFDPARVLTNITTTFERLQDTLEDRMVISYVGSTGTWYMMEEMLFFFKRLLNVQKSAVFLIITQSSEDEIFKLASRYNFPPGRLMVMPAERKQVPELLLLSDYSIFFIKPVFSKRASSATKMAEALAMGIPIITNRGWGDVEKIVEKSEAGLLVDELNPDAYDRAIRLMVKNIYYPENIRKIANKYFSLKEGVENYHQVYERLGRESLANKS